MTDASLTYEIALRRIVELDEATQSEGDDHYALYKAADIARRALGLPPRDGEEYLA